MLSLTIRKSSSTPIPCHSNHYVFHPTLDGFQNKNLWNPHVSCLKIPSASFIPAQHPRFSADPGWVSVSTITSMGNTTLSVSRALHRKPTAAGSGENTPTHCTKKNGSCRVWIVQFLNLYAVISCIVYLIDLDSKIENGEKNICNVLFLYCKWMEWCNAIQSHVM